MNSDTVDCIGADGFKYEVKRYAELNYNERNVPTGYSIPDIPSVPLVDRVYCFSHVQKHPLCIARYKMLAAKEHNIVEKQRPQDTTVEEARQMAETWFREKGFEKNEIDSFIKQYWN